ncbi:MAG: hypothetical protein PHT60_07510 [Acidiphilium sp.]|nr:hypothetical protein [Acidiphilium sp.]MDD4935611.1 hypothetical protein [Acidiphilium sp.]
MIFRRKPLDRRDVPRRTVETGNAALVRRRLIACWRRDASGRLIPYWKVVMQPQGEPPG